MDITYDSLCLGEGATVGSATLDCGREVMYFLWCNPAQPRHWIFSVTESANLVIQEDPQESDPPLYQASGVFSSDMCKEDIHAFIEERLIHYQEAQADQP